MQNKAFATKAEEGDAAEIWTLGKALRRASKSPKQLRFNRFWHVMATVLPVPKRNSKHGLRLLPTSFHIKSPLTRGIVGFNCSRQEMLHVTTMALSDSHFPHDAVCKPAARLCNFGRKD